MRQFSFLLIVAMLGFAAQSCGESDDSAGSGISEPASDSVSRDSAP